MLHDYQQLKDWLSGWSAESTAAFGRLPSQGARVAKARVYANELDMQKERFGNAFVRHLGAISKLVSLPALSFCNECLWSLGSRT